jgi:hypothetical protein
MTQKCAYKKKVTEFGYFRACRLRKYQIENRLPNLDSTNFFQNVSKTRYHIFVLQNLGVRPRIEKRHVE